MTRDNRAVALDGINRAGIVDALETAGAREHVVAWFASGDHLDREAWRATNHNNTSEAREATAAVTGLITGYSGPMWRLAQTLTEWTTELEHVEYEWQRERAADAALAGKGWAE